MNKITITVGFLSTIVLASPCFGADPLAERNTPKNTRQTIKVAHPTASQEVGRTMYLLKRNGGRRSGNLPSQLIQVAQDQGKSKLEVLMAQRKREKKERELISTMAGSKEEGWTTVRSPKKKKPQTNDQKQRFVDTPKATLR